MGFPGAWCQTRPALEFDPFSQNFFLMLWTVGSCRYGGRGSMENRALSACRRNHPDGISDDQKREIGGVQSRQDRCNGAQGSVIRSGRRSEDRSTQIKDLQHRPSKWVVESMRVATVAVGGLVVEEIPQIRTGNTRS